MEHPRFYKLFFTGIVHTPNKIIVNLNNMETIEFTDIIDLYNKFIVLGTLFGEDATEISINNLSPYSFNNDCLQEVTWSIIKDYLINKSYFIRAYEWEGDHYNGFIVYTKGENKPNRISWASIKNAKEN